MIERILTLSVQKRWLVVLLAACAALFGVQSLSRLPIDAVPDITNNQIQVTTVVPALSPFEVEKQVTFPVETALVSLSAMASCSSSDPMGVSRPQKRSVKSWSPPAAESPSEFPILRLLPLARRFALAAPARTVARSLLEQR